MTRRAHHSSNTTTTHDPPLPKTLTDGKPLPKLVVFDLDYTLWPFWVDTHVSPPLQPNPDASTPGHSVRDAHGGRYAFYAEVSGILSGLRDRGVLVGAASRTGRPELAREMLEMLSVPPAASSVTAAGREGGGGGDTKSDAADGDFRAAISVFDFLEIYPGTKTLHFARLQKRSAVPFAEMLFFDDETRNRNVEGLGVVMYLVRDGVSRAEFDKGVESWRKKNGREQS